METAAVAFLIICYCAASYLAWQQRSPIYVFAMASGHLSALASPLWNVLYGVSYGVSVSSVRVVITQPTPLSLLLAAGWHYPLPAMLVLYLYLIRWWFPGRVTGVLTYLIFLLYHLLIELLGLRAGLWSYREIALPLGLPSSLFAAIMAGLISYATMYVLLSTYRYAWQSMAMAIIPSVLLISLLTHGLLGAPLWIALALNGASWAVGLGTLSALALLFWAIQIITSGIRRVE
ncbi:MAG: hypothetical protein WCF99_16435 [Chloroflexales bacterium]